MLILAPTGRDAEGAAQLLGRDGITCRICADFDALSDAMDEQTGAVLVADEALTRVSLEVLSQRLAMQPPWSDLPFIVLSRSGAAARRALTELNLAEALGNVVVLERPLNVLGLVSAARSALRARRRQRQIGAHLAEQKKAAAALSESEARFRHMADSAPALIWMTDAAGEMIFANRHYPTMFGRPLCAFMGQGWLDDILLEDLERCTNAFRSAFRKRVPVQMEMRVLDRDGMVRWLRCEGVPRLDDSGNFLGYTGCNTDITEVRLAAGELEDRVTARTAELSDALGRLHGEIQERKQIEEALRQAQKMEAIGQLTGGIAHDFNNMLQGIAGSLEMMQRRIDQQRAGEAARFVEAARKTVDRAAALTNRLLAFARRQALQPKPVEPNALIDNLAELIRRTVGPGVEVELSVGESVWNVLCDPNQLENVLLNLAINARDAMPDGGRLTIRSMDVRLGTAELAGQDGAEPGEYVEIAVGDNGTGMPADVLARAFEPFFTTKPMGQGTGLGLSQIYGFVRQSGGVVRLESAVGSGTTVRLYLPRYRDSSLEALPGPEEAGPASAAPGLTVLVVEDEAVVRGMVVEAIRDLDCRVLEAEDGAAGLRLLRSQEAIDLLVTDVGLPGMNGRQLADAARESRPVLPVLLITGYAGAALTDWQLAPGMEVVGKPFRLEALVARVGEMLKRSLQPSGS
jgi:PAS domain S-box-containing protein